MSIEVFRTEDQDSACHIHHRKEEGKALLGYFYRDRKNILLDIHSDLVPPDVEREDTCFVKVGELHVPLASDGEAAVGHHLLHSNEDDNGLALPRVIVDILFRDPQVNHTMWTAPAVGFD